MPSIFGIFTSQSIRSGSNFSIKLNAAFPSSACATTLASYFSQLKCFIRPSRVLFSSSTIITLIIQSLRLHQTQTIIYIIFYHRQNSLSSREPCGDYPARLGTFNIIRQHSALVTFFFGLNSPSGNPVMKEFFAALFTDSEKLPDIVLVGEIKVSRFKSFSCFQFSRAHQHVCRFFTRETVICTA